MKENGFTLYISGPIRFKQNDNREAFDEAADYLSELNFRTIIPHDIVKDLNDDIRKIMLRDIETICHSCDGLYMLSGWSRSNGAHAEYYFARSIGLPIWGKNWFHTSNVEPYQKSLRSLSRDLQENGK